MNFSTITWTLFIGSAIALLYAIIRSNWIFKQNKGTAELQKISSYISNGAITFLHQEYKVLIPFVLIMATMLYFFNTGINKFQAFAFLLGAFASGTAGYIGMKVATAANSRTTEAAKKGINPALRIAFAGGSIMGMSVVGLSTLGLFILLFILQQVLSVTIINIQEHYLPIITGFSLGASAIALFARVGGGIFTKAADVGADLVGKVEKNIPEDDPRNPATIADNVGDNVGDVAGMGADLFESFIGSIIGSMILALASPVEEAYRMQLLFIPLILVVIGVVASIVGILCVRTKPGKSAQRALNTGTFVAAGIVIVSFYPILSFLLKDFEGSSNILTVNTIYISTILGLVSGITIGLLTEYYTGFGKKPVKKIVEQSESGYATNIISGLGVGMFSCLLPILVIAATVGISYSFAGLFGIAIAALGMLVTIGIQLAVDAYGPISDNAGGLAVMSNYPPEVREITDSLDSVGNTTAAIGKGFAIGSAALTAFILFTSFKESVGIDSIDLTAIPVLIGLMIGAVIPYTFSALTIDAVSKAAASMINEVRKQFKEKPGILQGNDTPDYNRCIHISTKSAIKEMILPGLGSIAIPVIIGFFGGIEMLSGLIVGTTVSGITLAIFMANSGGAWDNAKKMIEERKENGKGSETHKASVVGDTVGDPLKDTAGPSLNILIKLITIIALIIAPLL